MHSSERLNSLSEVILSTPPSARVNSNSVLYVYVTFSPGLTVRVVVYVPSPSFVPSAESCFTVYSHFSYLWFCHGRSSSNATSDVDEQPTAKRQSASIKITEMIFFIISPFRLYHESAVFAIVLALFSRQAKKIRDVPFST